MSEVVTNNLVVQKSREAFSSIDWAKVNLQSVPKIARPVPGQRSREMHARCIEHFTGLSNHTQLFPVAFDSGSGCVLTDVEGNRYLDFSSGICVATLGHGHPKVVEAITQQFSKLANCHDFTTPLKTELCEKLADLLPGDLNCFQFYDSGATAVEAGLRAMRTISGRLEFASCENDFHGRTFATASLSGQSNVPGMHLLPRPDVYRPRWTDKQGSLDTSAYTQFFDEYLNEHAGGKVAGFVLEPIQGWAGAIMPPPDFFPELRKFCDERGLLLMADEILTGWGRTGEWLSLNQCQVVPDVVAIGKSLGNGFPVSCLAVREKHRDKFENLKASSSTGGNPVACAAALAVSLVIEQENLLAHARHLGKVALKRLERMKSEHAIIGDVRATGCLMAIELVKDRETKDPFPEAGRRIYELAFSRGLAWIPAGHILRLSPPIVMDDRALLAGLDLIDEAIGEVSRELGIA